jgi:hypothetical protein
MSVFLTELAATYGSVRQYVTDYLGVPESMLSELTALYTTS